MDGVHVVGAWPGDLGDVVQRRWSKCEISVQCLTFSCRKFMI